MNERPREKREVCASQPESLTVLAQESMLGVTALFLITILASGYELTEPIL